MGVSKVIYGGRTLIDLTADTVEASKLLTGFKAHGPDGEVIEGSCEFDVDSSAVTAKAAEILAGKTAAIKGSVVTGSMTNRGAVAGSIDKKDGQYTVPQGYHDGSGKVGIATAEQQKLIPANIREGITILGVSGSMSGTEGANPQAKSVTPTTSQQVIAPDEGYNYLSQVTVAAIPYSEIDNDAGGTTVTIA